MVEREREGTATSGAARENDRRAQQGEVDGRDMVQSVGDFVRTFEWTHVVTLTSRYELHPEQIRKEFMTFIADISRRAGTSVDWFYAIENTHEGRAHLHGSVWAPALSTKDVSDSWAWRYRRPSSFPNGKPKNWNRGRSLVEAYRPDGNWFVYAMENYGGPLLDWDISARQRGKVA